MDTYRRERRLQDERLHVKFLTDVGPTEPISPRCYTLTHSDITGELFLTIGLECDESQIRGWYTRFMKDEVLAEGTDSDEGLALHIYCHVSGGFVFGSARWRFNIFHEELPMVLEALRYGDHALFAAHPQLDNAPIVVHFASTVPRYNVTERWGVPADYR